MSDAETENKPKRYLRKDELKYGEAYRTTKSFTWSNFDNNMAKIVVPPNELLIYRISKAYQPGTELVLFVWLAQKMTICLSATDTSILFVKHMEWEQRHNDLDISEREDDTQEIKTIPKKTDKADSESNKG